MFARLVLFTISSLATLSLNAQPTSATTNSPVLQFVDASNTFAFSLQNTASKSDENLVFAPYSVFNCLSMVYAGAKGETALGIQKALSLPLNALETAHAASSLRASLITPAKEGCGLQFTSANGLFADEDTFILSSFRELIQKNYQAELASLNFGQSEKSLMTINGWISNETKGKIPRLLDSNDINSSTRLVLVNAAYFRGQWLHPFDPKQTEEAPFHAKDDQEMNVQMMQQTASLSYYESGSAQILSLPFQTCDAQDPRINCVIVLPKSSADKVDLDKELSATMLADWINHLESQKVNVRLPRFCLKMKLDLGSALAKMGMANAFTDAADFSSIDGMHDLFLSKILHETFFSLDEFGVEAAAATAAVINMKSSGPDGTTPVLFQADHPFYFFVMDRKTNAILFAGKILEPDAATCQ